MPIEDRPEIPTDVDRTAKRETERALKSTRRMVRQLEARVDQRLAATGKLVKTTEHAMRLGAGILGVAWPGLVKGVAEEQQQATASGEARTEGAVKAPQ